MPRPSVKCWRCPRKSFRLPACVLAGRPRKAASRLVCHWIRRSMKNASRTATWRPKSTLTTTGVRPGVRFVIKETLSASAAAIFTAGRKIRRGNMPFHCALISALSCERRVSVWIDPAALFFADTKGQDAVGFRFFFERITGLAQEIWNVDAGQRIGALGDDKVA